MSILNVELKIIWEVIYDNQTIELEIEDSGLDCYYYGVQLVDQNKEDKPLLETIYLENEMTEDNEELNANIVKWLGSSNKEKIGLGLGIFIGKTLLEKNFASVNCWNSKTRSGAEVVIKWKNSQLFKI